MNALESLAYISNACATVPNDREASSNRSRLEDVLRRKLKPPEITVQLEAPPGIGAVQTFSGRRITIGEDRIVEMSAEDANCLIRAGWTKLAEWSADEAA